MTATLQEAAGVERHRAAEAASARPGFRADIDGLRAVAVLLVVLYHAHVPGFMGGFLGVDVFFVISGFLITQILTTELEVTSTLELGRFWARRARRLLPAASLMVAVVLVAAVASSTVLHWQTVAGEAIGTSLYWSNQHFAGRATDYFETGVASSPLLHTWSLAVEEQFYLLWPLLLLGATRLATRSGSSPARVRTAVVAIVTVGSLAVSISLDRSPLGFYSAASRAWELGLGALLAFAVPAIARRTRPWIRSILSGLGVLLVVVALTSLGGHHAASVPVLLLAVLGTAALLAAGVGGTWPGIGLLTTAAAQSIGRLSYSWYLWHWPVLVIGLRYTDSDSVATRLTLVALSLVPAVVTHRFVERPFRHHRRLVASVRTTMLVGAAAVVTVTVLAVGVWVVAEGRLRAPALVELTKARQDRPPLDPACATTDVKALYARCAMGDPTAERVILVIGDSHAAQWLPAIDSAAERAHFKVIASVQGNCPAVGHGWTRGLPSCGERLKHLPSTIDELQPSLVVAASASGYVGGLLDGSGERIPASRQLAAWEAAHTELATHLRTSGIPLLQVLEVPDRTTDPLDCLAGDDDAGCTLSRASASASVASVHRAETAALARAGHGTVLDPIPLVCGTASCPLKSDGLVMYVDAGHLTSTFSRSLAPAFSARIAQLDR